MHTSELRAVRSWLNESRWRLLDGFITVNDAIKEHEAKAKRELAATLRAMDEFAAPKSHEDYRP